MTLLPACMLTLTLAVFVVVAPRIAADWLRYQALSATGDQEGLQRLLRQKNGWVLRHSICAIAGVGLVAMMQTLPSLNPPEHLVAVTTCYSALSFLFALTESLLALKITPLVANSSAVDK